MQVNDTLVLISGKLEKETGSATHLYSLSYYFHYATYIDEAVRFTNIFLRVTNLLDGAIYGWGEVLAQSRAQWSQGSQRLEALPCYVPESATNWRRQTDGHTQIQFGGCVYDLLFSILYRLSVS